MISTSSKSQKNTTKAKRFTVSLTQKDLTPYSDFASGLLVYIWNNGFFFPPLSYTIYGACLIIRFFTRQLQIAYLHYNNPSEQPIDEDSIFFDPLNNIETAILTFALIYAYTYVNGCEKSNRRYSQWFTRLSFWKAMWNYFPITIDITKPLPADRKYVIGLHPHGIFGYHAVPFVFDVYDLFPGLSIRVLAASMLLRVPFFREILMAIGFIDASSSVARRALREGCSILVCPGGSREMLDTDPEGDMKLIINKRKGFIRLALQEGADLVPTITFGISDLYYKTEFLDSVKRFMLDYFRIGWPTVWGRFLSLMPLKRPLHVVVDEPLQTKRVDFESLSEHERKDLIDHYHALYKQRLIALYEENKARFGHENRKLICC